jgi:Ca-activated chloride channel family protein
MKLKKSAYLVSLLSLSILMSCMRTSPMSSYSAISSSPNYERPGDSHDSYITLPEEVEAYSSKPKPSSSASSQASGNISAPTDKSKNSSFNRSLEESKASSPVNGSIPPVASSTSPSGNDGVLVDKDESTNTVTTTLSYGINKFKETSSEPDSTFAVDVDTASYTLMRNSINNANSLPGKESVRIEEYVNYFDYSYPKPEKGFSINTEITNSPFTKDANKKLLRIGLQGREIKIENRKDAIITLVIDTSGSMTEKNKLETIKSSIKIFLKQLAPKDRISIIAYSNEAKILIDNADISQENQILDALSKLQSSGGTNIEAGLTKGSEIAQKNYVSGAINRVLLCSDGANTMGESNAKAILDRIKKQSEVSGINFSSIGVGFENYNDQFLEQVATNGDGYYAYIDSIKEAVKVFVENATNTLQVIAKDAKVQVKFNPKSVSSYRLIGYENKILNSSDFRNDKVDAGEIGPNHSVTALYEIQTLPDSKESNLVDVVMRYKDVDLNETVLETSKSVLTSEIEPDFNKASYSFRLASTVALYAEILRGSYWSLENNLDNVSNQITSLQSIKSDEKVSELKTLVDKAKALGKTK